MSGTETPVTLGEFDRVVAIGRSGTTTEVGRALGTPLAGMPVTAILGELDTPIAKVATVAAELSNSDEHGFVQTRFPATSLTLLRPHLGESATAVSELISRARAVVPAPTSD